MVILKGNKNSAQIEFKLNTELGCVYEEMLCQIMVSNKNKIILF